ncbi:uracil/xanthine transporter [Paenibacillus ginsengarvi]|uniref:Uracil/xanthine transporter n=1 Tax=Paenibacillus ginsengarvi TaxID=400777 RepID=A0A3B0BCP3_9BACL|nr:uracil/xanthine transporter [Paenibacillus ginsengarvi]RKN70118.1 uracil/xanthine transporter [Paenibacillus ginsengarvi]
MKRSSQLETFLGSLQWLFFIFANTVVVPLSVGAAFGLSGEEIAAAMQRSFLLTGAACSLQALIGHRYPLLEGHSGMWWGMLLGLAGSAPSLGLSLTGMGGAVALGIIASGLLTFLIGATGFSGVLARLFGPVVTCVYLFLLALQLTLIFFKGMIGYVPGHPVRADVLVLSVCVAILVIIVQSGKGAVRNYAVLIGIAAGWIVYSLWIAEPAATDTGTGEGGASLLGLFPWGTPHLEWGVFLTAMVTGLLNASNNLAAIRGADELYGRRPEPGSYRRSFMLTGGFTSIAGAFGLVPYAPFTSTLGFLQTTGLLKRAPFILGSALFIVVGLVPPLGAHLSAMPMTVAQAVLFVAYWPLFGSALRAAQGITLTNGAVLRLAGPVIVGVSLMNVPAEAFLSLPALIRPMLSNGLLMGVLVAVISENVFVRGSGPAPESGVR